MSIKRKEFLCIFLYLSDRAIVSLYEFFPPYLTISTAPALTFGSLPVTDILAVKDPSMLKTTHSVFGGITAMKKSSDV